MKAQASPHSSFIIPHSSFPVRPPSWSGFYNLSVSSFLHLVDDEFEAGDRHHEALVLAPGRVNAREGRLGEKDFAALREVFAELRGEVHFRAVDVLVLDDEDFAIADAKLAVHVVLVG